MLGEGSETNHDKFYFLPNTDNTWCIKNIQSGKYIAGGNPNKWSMYWSELTDANSSKWTVETSVFGKKIIKSRQTGGYIGCDDTAAGSSLWCDKGGDTANSQWTLVPTQAAGVEITAAEDCGIRVSSTPEGIEVRGADSAQAFTLAGAQVASANGDPLYMTVSSGIYIVKANAADSMTVCKVAVR